MSKVQGSLIASTKVYALTLWFAITALNVAPFNAYGESVTGAGGSNAVGVIRTSAGVRALPREVAAQGLPVVLRGVVTFKWPVGIDGGFVVHDETAGVYVSGRVEDERTLGTRVEVTGVTAPGGYAPIVSARSVRELGAGELPPARPASVAELLSGRFDCQRVEIRGVVRATSYAPEYGMLNLDLATESGIVTVNVMPARPDDGRLFVDAEVAVCGVAFPIFNPRAELMGVKVRTGALSDMTVLKPAPTDPFGVPCDRLATLMPFSTEGLSLHRRRVAGTVTVTRRDGVFYLQDGDHAIRVKTRPEWIPRVGDAVEVAGFVETRDFFAGMENASVRTCAPFSSAPVPKRVTPSMILDYNTSLPAGQPDYDGLLVCLRGRLKSLGEGGREGRYLYLECDGVLVPVDLGTDSLKAFADLRVDSELEVTGACVVSYTNLRPVMNYSKAVAFRLLLRSPGDVVVVQQASWWTARRLLWALSGSAVLLVLVLLWNMQLRRRVERRTARLAVEMSARLTAESRIGERTRLAAELHDSLAQSLTGVALQLQAAEMARVHAPEEIPQHVALARELLDASREEVRRCVWDLRSQVLDQRDLPAAIAEVGRQMGGGARVEVCTEGDVFPLSDMAAHALLRCAQESMTNAVSHGFATVIQVLLRFAADHVSLRVEDNGCGFDPALAPGMEEGHFGLQGMRERVKRLEGEFTLASQPGQGTQVDIRISLSSKERSVK